MKRSLDYREEPAGQPDGVFISGRATRSMDRFAVRRDGNNIVVDLDKLFRQDQNPDEWARALVSL